MSTSPEEWKFVERLLPSTIIPSPPDGKSFPSGWQPQTGKENEKKLYTYYNYYLFINFRFTYS